MPDMRAEKVFLQTVIARMNVHLSLAIITCAPLGSCNKGIGDCSLHLYQDFEIDGTLVDTHLPDGEGNEQGTGPSLSTAISIWLVL